MGIFSFIKKRFDIVPKDKDLKTIVTKYGSVDYVRLNAKLVVPEGYSFVIGRRGKVCDVFESGEYKFEYTNLPMMCKRFHIDKQKGKEQTDKFPADFYFVNMGLRSGNFATYRKVEMGTKAYGYFSVKVYGVYSYRVVNVTEYMQSLLNEFDYIKTGEAESILEGWVNEILVEELESQNFILKDVVANSPIITNALKLRVSKLFAVAGLELVDLKITKYKLPKQHQEESDLNIARQQTIEIEMAKEATKNSELKEEEQISDETEANKTNEAGKAEANITKQQYYQTQNIDGDVLEAQNLLKQFGIGEDEHVQNSQHQQTSTSNNKELRDKQILESEERACEDDQSQKNTQNFTTSETEANEQPCKLEPQEIEKDNDAKQANEGGDEYIPFGNFVIEDAKDNKQPIIQKTKEKTFVDLTLNGLYNNNAKSKRCLNCGTENNLDADHCLICGENFNKGELYE